MNSEISQVYRSAFRNSERAGDETVRTTAMAGFVCRRDQDFCRKVARYTSDLVGKASGRKEAWCEDWEYQSVVEELDAVTGFCWGHRYCDGLHKIDH